MFAAVLENLVWGMGDTAKEARDEAIGYLDKDPDAGSSDDLEIHKITLRQAELIDAGEINWTELRMRQ